MASFLDNLADLDLSDEELQRIKSTVVTKHVSKGQILLRKGDKCRKAFYVKSGCLRSYAVDAKGKEHIFMFAPEGWIISDMEAHVNDIPAQLFIDAVEDSEVEVFDNQIFSMPIPPTQQAVAKLVKRISVLQKRVIMLMSASLQERYLDFVETYPNIVQRVPQKMIASYLGVTPEALSKMRGDLSKQG